jgi:phospholipase A-2-activating protein
MPQYQLSQTITTDGEPVRTLAITASHLISGSESGTLSSIPIAPSPSSAFLDPAGLTIQPGGEGTRHSHHITASVVLPQSIGGYATGCKDQLIRIFDSNDLLIGTLKGHTNAVTSLSMLAFPQQDTFLLISGSWDGSAKLWDVRTHECMATLPGHENTVSVQGLPPTGETARLATGSAGIAQNSVISEHKIRLWEVVLQSDKSVKVKLQQTVSQDHQGPIRDLAYDPTSQMLLSCSNDGSVKVRDAMMGEAVTTLSCPGQQSQPPMLLSVDATRGGKIVAASEDGNLIIWNVAASAEEAIQVIAHPNCVWKVLVVEANGDLVTACHDGMIRVFTMDEARIASDAERVAFEDDVMKARSKKSAGPSKAEIAALPKWEMNSVHLGKSEGQVQVFNKNGTAIAAQWSAASATWIEVGEVTGSNENAGTINGVQYDHVFPIEIDVASGGVQSLQIGYNNGENPFAVAQKFMDDYMLDQGYLAQIADYIRNRVGEDAGPTLGMAAGGAPASSGPTPMEITPTPMSAPSYTHLPMRGYKAFETGADAKILFKVCIKIREFNESLENNLAPEQVTSVLDGLCQTIAATNRYHATRISDEELSIVHKMMKDWSLEHVFPSIDLARLLALHPDACKSSRSVFWNGIVKCALDRCDVLLASHLEGTPKTAIPMLSFRLFSNCLRGGCGSQRAVESHLVR